MESLIENGLDADEMHFNNHNIPRLTPELLFSPLLEKLFFQQNTTLPPSLFQKMPALQVLNLSGTNIQSLPPSIFKLRLLKEFILQECSLLVEVPPGIGELKNLKLFDLEGTEIMYLPKEIGKLQTLELLRVSLSAYADEHKDRNCIEHIIPRMTISKLTKLKELSISVSPEAEWWEVELLEAIMGDLLFLPDLITLKLYLPTDKSLQTFLSLERNQVPIYSSLWDYRLLTGHCEQLPFSVQLDTEVNFLKLEKCVKYMNGEGYTDEIVDLIRNARALYLRRHWTIEHLPVSDMRKMKYCMLMECNEMKTVVHQDELCGDKNKAAKTGEDEVLGSLQYLAIHFMKKLQSILKGPISRNGLSSLRILALHSCPELTTIFTEFLLVNLQCLTEIVVEDCPKVNCLVNLEEGTPWAKGPFLPNLRRISLLDLPELVSISAGICIAPQLDTLIVFNCMRVNYLSVMELPRGIKAIKGEIEWWNALIYGKLTWNSVFVQLKRDGVLMDQLAEDTNSLQHFLELKMVPSLPGRSWKVNQNSSRDTKEDMEHVDQLQIIHNDTQSVCAGTASTRWEPPCPASGKPDVKVPNNKLLPTKTNCRSIGIAKWIQLEKRGLNIGCQVSSDNVWRKNFKHPRNIKVTKLKNLAKVNEGALDDGYSWGKYGEKSILGDKYPRSFYRCSFSNTYGCIAKKTVQRSIQDPSIFEVNYRGKHTCPPPLSSNCFSTETELACRFLRIQDSSAETESVSTITDSYFEPVIPQVLDINKKKSSSIRDTEWTQQMKVSSKTGSDMPPDDGYIWRMYGQKDIFKAKYPRSYYKCSSRGCIARKQVQRSNDDPSIWEITYERVHTCLRLSVTSDSADETESALRIVKNSNSSSATASELRILRESGSSSTIESTSTITDNSSGLDSMGKMSGSASIQRWKQQTKEIRSSFSPSLKQQLTSSRITSEPNMIISEIEENSSRNLLSSLETPPNTEKRPPILETYQARKTEQTRNKKLGNRITELQQLVSPFGKTDTASVLLETHGYIKFLQEQVNVLMAPYTIQGTPFEPKQQTPKQDLRSRGLCLVPVSSTFPVTNQITINSSTPVFGERPDEPNADIYKDEQLLSEKNKCHNQNNNDIKSRLGRVWGKRDVDKSYLYSEVERPLMKDLRPSERNKCVTVNNTASTVASTTI